LPDALAPSAFAGELAQWKQIAKEHKFVAA
jgi:hypothetical protein